MKTVTEALKSDQTTLKPQYFKRVKLYRAVWNGGTNEYDWSTAIDLEEWLGKINNIAWKLDSIALNIWRTSNVTIELDNRDDYWDSTNTSGVWNGYFVRGSKIEIQAGNILNDGTEDLLYIFTGIIDRDIEIFPENKTAQIYISGLEQMLVRADAENVSTLRTDQNLGVGTGAQTDYVTLHNGIGRIDEVKVDAAVKEIGVDYNISGFNDKDNPATISFTSPPAGGTTIYATYIEWYQDKTFEWLIEELVKEADISNYEISAVNFPNNVEVTWTEDQTTGEFDQGTASAIDTSGDELKLFEEDHFTEINNSTKYIATRIDTDTLTYGQKKTKFKAVFAAAPPGYNWTVQILDSSDVIKYEEDIYVGFPILSVNWERIIDLSQWFNPGNTWKIKRLRNGGSDPAKYTENLLVTWPATAWGEDGKFVSQYRDCTASLTNFGKLLYSASIPAGTSLAFYTQTAAAPGGPWDPEVAIGGTGDILSAVKRYIRYVVYFTSVGDDTPIIESISVKYYTSTFVIEMANFSGSTCKSAIEQLALMPDYEWGFNALGTFFFRSKSTSEQPVMSLSDDINRIILSSYSTGYEWIRNQIEAEFGNYTDRRNPITEGESRPHSFDKYGVRKLSVSGGNLLGNGDINIASGISERYYDTYKNPKFRSRVRITFLPQLDLGDIIALPYNDRNGSSVWSKNFKIVGITLNLESYYLELDLQEI